MNVPIRLGVKKPMSEIIDSDTASFSPIVQTLLVKAIYIIRTLYRFLEVRPRVLGTFVSVITFLILLRYLGFDIWASILVSLLWMLGLLLGGRYDLVLWLIRAARPLRVNTTKRWGGAFWGGLLSVVFGSWSILGPDVVLRVAEAVAVPFCLCYGISKLGCYSFCCCGWSPLRSIGICQVPLQLLEATVSLISSVLIFGLIVYKVTPYGVFLAFILQHAALRVFSRWARGSAQSTLGAALMYDSGFIITAGILVLFF